jgi:nitrite reductase/ring-hydroxylating ferredoxin subunit
MAMQKLCSVAALPVGEAREFTIAGRRIFAFRNDDHVHVYLNRCPHLGSDLNWQENDFFSPDRQHIRCATHGALFRREDGLCIAGPCRGAALHSLPARIEDDAIFVSC